MISQVVICVCVCFFFSMLRPTPPPSRCFFLVRTLPHGNSSFSCQDHEIHRQWVALVDDENPRDSGTQGYLQLSIAIVGPGDKLKVRREGRGVRASGRDRK